MRPPLNPPLSWIKQDDSKQVSTLLGNWEGFFPIPLHTFVLIRSPLCPRPYRVIITMEHSFNFSGQLVGLIRLLKKMFLNVYLPILKLIIYRSPSLILQLDSTLPENFIISGQRVFSSYSYVKIQAPVWSNYIIYNLIPHCVPTLTLGIMIWTNLNLLSLTI